MVIVLYVPALHQGYVQFFEKYKDAERLYILGEDVLADFPLSQREIRCIAPEKMQKILQGASFFPEVNIASKKVLKELSSDNDLKIVTSIEDISDSIVEHYFSKQTVIRDQVFLRYEEGITKRARQEVAYDGTVTTEQFHCDILSTLNEEKARSSDYFLQVAAAAVMGDQIVAIDHNTRMPTPHEMHTVGDPRNFMQYGTDTHQRTTLHAEQAVIAECARRGISLEGADFYVNIFPCPDCSQVIAKTGVKRLFFATGYSELSTLDTFKLYGIEIIRIIDKEAS